MTDQLIRNLAHRFETLCKEQQEKYTDWVGTTRPTAGDTYGMGLRVLACAYGTIARELRTAIGDVNDKESIGNSQEIHDPSRPAR